MPIFIGTAGYVYPHWRKGAFYPPGLPHNRELAHYLSHYPAVEINATFHAFPRPATLAKWAATAAAAPASLFALKAPGLITHTKRLVHVADDVASFLRTAADTLGPHLGPVLFQCPPSLPCSLPLLEALLDAAAAAPRVAVEFRSPDWFCDPVYALLAARDVALVNNVVVRDDDFATVHEAALPHRRDHPAAPRASWAYNRFHGSKAPGVATAFPDSVLRRFAKQAVLDIRRNPAFTEFSFFLNDLDAVAPVSARRYTELVAEEASVRVRELFSGFVPQWTKKKNTIATFFKPQTASSNQKKEESGAQEKREGTLTAGHATGMVLKRTIPAPIKTVSSSKKTGASPKKNLSSLTSTPSKPFLAKAKSAGIQKTTRKAKGKNITSYFAPAHDND